MASSIESDRGASIMNALNDFQRQEELVSTAYTQFHGVFQREMLTFVRSAETINAVVSTSTTCMPLSIISRNATSLSSIPTRRRGRTPT